ncbi:uncharacterized protein PAC_15435 [Phialocephala subalpina]|uniref:Heterokaryon incompatibility domain-containing protein n=1 Tax=Phialocephala subalpina TaxID=576137 RepID=A0A1L7XKE8_9HELO|nr:uncharacterized protein PAC_15435 [Phialocephala subalpina]
MSAQQLWQSNLERLSNETRSFPTSRQQLCEACERITLETLGCSLNMTEEIADIFRRIPDLHRMNLDDIHGYLYPHTVGELDALRKQCALCAQIYCAIYRGGDFTTTAMRDKNNRIKLSYFKLLSSGTGCLRIYLSSTGAMGNVTPLLLRVFVDPVDEEGFAHLGFGRSIVSPESELAFQRLRSKMGECERNHPTCSQTYAGVDCGTGSPLPSRLLYINPKANEKFCLRETRGTRGKYVALSYCWGQDEGPDELKLTKETYQALQESIPVERLPKTIRDAMTISKTLGFRFLWVDRLCIIQNDNADWEAEARLMGSIYEFADFTIAAIGAHSPEEGCFLERELEPAAVLPTKVGNIYVSQIPTYLDRNREVPQLSSELQQSRWAFRGWTFQERICSRRIIYYGEDQVIWECRNGIDTESRFGADPGYLYNSSLFSYSSDLKKRLDSMAPLSRYRDQFNLQVTSMLGTKPSGDWLKWDEIVAAYSMLDLSYEKDRLPALGSITRVIGDNIGLEFCAGMCLEGIQKALFWWPFSGDERTIEDFVFDKSVVELYWDLDRPVLDCFKGPSWLTDPQCTAIWKDKNKVNVFWGKPGSRRVRTSKSGAPSWSWLAAGSAVSFYSFFKQDKFTLDAPKFIRTEPPKLECLVHIFSSRRTRLRWPQVTLNSSIQRMSRNTEYHRRNLRVRWEGPVYGLIVPELDEDREHCNGIVLFDEASGKLPLLEGPDDPPSSFECMIVGASEDPIAGENMDKAVQMFIVVIQRTNLQDEYKRLGVAYLEVSSDSEFLAKLLAKSITMYYIWFRLAKHSGLFDKLKPAMDTAAEEKKGDIEDSESEVDPIVPTWITDNAYVLISRI